MNTVPIFNKYTRALKALMFSIRYPNIAKQSVKKAIQFIYSEGNLQLKNLPKIALEQIVNPQQIILKNFYFRDGSVTSYELIVIASIVYSKQPLNLLEIGTFEGNTTLQMAANAPENALIHTLDLPTNKTYTHLPILEEDCKYIKDKQKKFRRFFGALEEKKIIQHLGDSATYDFRQFIQIRPIDFCFIDGSHSYACVKCDTEKVFDILSTNGTVLWHDFDPNFPGVYNYLNELSKQIPLFHIKGTTLVIKTDEIPNL